MSLDATRWAWAQQQAKGTAKLVLLSLADRADENHTCYPSISRLTSDTGMDRKTIMRNLKALESVGLIRASRQFGRFNSYQLIGVSDRHQTSTNNGTSPQKGTGTKIGTTPVPKLVPEPVPKLGHKPTNEPTNNPPRVNCCARFAEFWDEYPAKVGKKSALAKWKARKLDRIADQIIADIRGRRARDPRWLAGYIPNPLTYINQDRWDDEIPTGADPNAEFK